METLSLMFSDVTRTDIIAIISIAIGLTILMTFLIYMGEKWEKRAYDRLSEYAEIPIKSGKEATIRRQNFTTMIKIWQATKENFTVSLEFTMGEYETGSPIVKMAINGLILPRKADGFFFNEIIQGIDFPFPYNVRGRKWHGRKYDSLQIRIDKEEKEHILRQSKLVGA